MLNTKSCNRDATHFSVRSCTESRTNYERKEELAKKFYIENNNFFNSCLFLMGLLNICSFAFILVSQKEIAFNFGRKNLLPFLPFGFTILS